VCARGRVRDGKLAVAGVPLAVNQSTGFEQGGVGELA